MEEPLDDEKVYSIWPKDGPADKLCKCSKCGIVKRCCPSFDFYRKPEDPSLSLFCLNCLLDSEGCDDIIIWDMSEDFLDTGEKDDPADWWKEDE